MRYDLAFGAGNDPLDGMDRFGRVVDLLWRNYGNSTDAVRIKHGYDRAGNRLWREDPVAAANSKYFDELYGYDGLYQLKSLDRGDLNGNHDAITSKNFAESWSLDMTGNWSTYKKDDDGNGTWELDQSRTHNTANEISQIAGASTHVAHDRAGNMTKTPKPTDWSAHYDLTYDAWNRLVKVMDGQTTVATYAYDARNFRVSKTASGTTRHYYYSDSSWRCLEERVDASSYAERQFVWGMRYVDDLVLRDRNADSNTGTGSLGIASSGLEERLYALQDRSWSVAAIVNTSGSAQERYLYDGFGTSTVLTGSFGSRSSTSYDWECRYTGQRLDAETGLLYYRQRYYAPWSGRFIHRDPIGRGDGVGLYAYVRNRPLFFLDPRGEEDEEVDPEKAYCKEAGSDPTLDGWKRAHTCFCKVTYNVQVVAGRKPLALRTYPCIFMFPSVCNVWLDCMGKCIFDYWSHWHGSLDGKPYEPIEDPPKPDENFPGHTPKGNPNPNDCWSGKLKIGPYTDPKGDVWHGTLPKLCGARGSKESTTRGCCYALSVCEKHSVVACMGKCRAKQFQVSDTTYCPPPYGAGSGGAQTHDCLKNFAGIVKMGSSYNYLGSLEDQIEDSNRECCDKPFWLKGK